MGRIDGLGRAMTVLDGLGAEEIHRGTLRASFNYEVLDLMDDLRDFDRGLAELRRVSEEWGLAIRPLLRGMVEE